MNKKTAFSVFFVACMVSLASAEEKIDLPEPVIEYIGEHESIRNNLVKWYAELISQDRLAALAAIDRLQERKAFVVLAAGSEKALPGVSNAIIDALLTSPNGNKPVIKALSNYLLAGGPPILSGGENLTGQRLRNEKLIAGISRIAEVPSSDVDINSSESIAAFVAKVNKKIGE